MTVRVLVADDSPTVRRLIRMILTSDPAVSVVGEATDGIEAVEMTKALRPDVITMDNVMPRLDGLAATKRIMTEQPTPIVLVSGILTEQRAELTVLALAAGALTVLWPPHVSEAGRPDVHNARFIETVKAMAGVKVIRHRPSVLRPAAATAPPVGLRPARQCRPRAIAIVASTGGPAALHEVLRGLGASPVPVFVVQHMAAGFTEGFARWLDSQTPDVTVRLAEEGEAPVPGVVYVAPDGCHLTLRSAKGVHLSERPPVGGFRPSGSVMFESLASVHGSALVAVVLTGMGSDGVQGLQAVAVASGTVIVQDAATSVVNGMPAAAVAAGYGDHVLPLSQIGPALAAMLMPGR